MAYMIQDKAIAGSAATTGERAGVVINEVGIIDLAALTTHANSDTVACMFLPARHRFIDAKLLADADLDTGSTPAKVDVVVMDEDTGAVEYTVVNSAGCAAASVTDTLTGDAAVLSRSYFEDDRPVGISIEEHTGLATSGKLYVSLSYAPIGGWETLIPAD